MNKLYLKKCWIYKYQDNVNGRNRVTISWEIDFSILPEIERLLEFLEIVMKPKEWNDIDPSLSYADSRHQSFTFTTSAWVKCKEGDKYNDNIGYQLAMTKAQRKALKIYNRLLNTIFYKMHKYFVSPLYDIQNHVLKMDTEMYGNFNRKVKEFNN